MTMMIETPKISEILYEEFILAMNLSAGQPAQDIHVSVSMNLLHDGRKLSADTSIRLARYSGVSDLYFMNLQNDIDQRRIFGQEERMKCNS